MSRIDGGCVVVQGNKGLCLVVERTLSGFTIHITRHGEVGARLESWHCAEDLQTRLAMLGAHVPVGTLEMLSYVAVEFA